MKSQDVIVIGAGIIGVSIGLELQKSGFKVKIIDRDQPGQGASFGNAGAFAFSDIVPLATPGIIKVAPRWLLDPLGPLSIPPSYALTIVPWLLKFFRASWSDRFPALMSAQVELMTLSRDALERQVMSCNGEKFLLREGQLRLYDNEALFRRALPYWDACREYGIKHELLHSNEAIGEIQPGLDPRFKFAGYTPNWINTRDPKKWFDHLFATFLSRGGEFLTQSAQSLSFDNDLASVHCDGETLPAKFIVVSAGAWSKNLAVSIGDNAPLETERGYNTTLSEDKVGLRTHLTFPDHGFVVSKNEQGLRVGGAVELGGLSAPPNFKRSENLLKKAKKFLPGLVGSEGKEWMGFRPSMPDSLPVLGASSRSRRVLYAFGHGHLGLTQAAATGELIRNAVLGQPWPISKKPFSITRF